MTHSSMYEDALIKAGYTANVFLIVGGYALHYKNRRVDILTHYTGDVDDAVLRVMLRHIKIAEGGEG